MSSIQLSTEAYFDNAHKELLEEIKGVNQFSIPTIDKVSINVGVGKFENKDKTAIADYLLKLTGQNPKTIASKKSIAGFKLRAGDIVGYVVTLRGKKARDFILSLVYICLPRTRDFKGIKLHSFDSNFSSYSLGIENSSIFPLIGFDTSVNFGMQINVVFKNKSENNKLLLQKLHFPFHKNN